MRAARQVPCSMAGHAFMATLCEARALLVLKLASPPPVVAVRTLRELGAQHWVMTIEFLLRDGWR